MTTITDEQICKLISLCERQSVVVMNLKKLVSSLETKVELLQDDVKWLRRIIHNGQKEMP